MKNFIVVAIVFLSCISVSSQEKRLALVIGNGNYARSALANPVNDAKTIEEALKGIGFEVMQFENLDQKEMARVIDDFGNRLRKYDVGLFFYAGHGLQSQGFNYLQPVDARLFSESDVEYNCVRADRVLGKMEDAKNKINIVILDACRDNPFERSWTRTAKGRGLATMTAPVGSVIAFATSPGSTASDGTGKNGLYTSGLLTYINEPGITAIQMFQKVTAYVLKKSSNQQLPWVSTSLTGDFYLVPGSATANTEALNRPEEADNATNIEKSVVVLPFKNLTGNPDKDYLVQGQSEALRMELSTISQVKQQLRVLGGTSGSSIAKSSQPITELAIGYNFDYIIEGSVFNVGDSVNLQLSLIKVLPDEKLLWTNKFKSDIANSEKLYNNLAGQISGKIGIGLTTENIAKLPAPRKINPETYATYLRAKYNINTYTPEGLKKGIEYLHQVLRADPGDPYAYAALSIGYIEIAHGPLDSGDAIEKAKAAAMQAIKLDTTMAEVYTALGLVTQYYDWKFDLAEKYFKKALALNPNSADTHYHYSWGLFWLDKLDEAIAEHELAQKYDPFNPGNTAWLGLLYLSKGRYDDALNECQKAFEIQKDYPVCYFVIGHVYLAQGKLDEAIATFKKLAELDPEWISALGSAYAATGHPEETRKIIAEILKGDITPFQANGLAGLYGALGDKENAIKWLDHRPYHPWIPYTAKDLKNLLGGDPRYEALCKRINPPEH